MTLTLRFVIYDVLDTKISHYKKCTLSKTLIKINILVSGEDLLTFFYILKMQYVTDDLIGSSLMI